MTTLTTERVYAPWMAHHKAELLEVATSVEPILESRKCIGKAVWQQYTVTVHEDDVPALLLIARSLQDLELA